MALCRGDGPSLRFEAAVTHPCVSLSISGSWDSSAARSLNFSPKGWSLCWSIQQKRISLAALAWPDLGTSVRNTQRNSLKLAVTRFHHTVGPQPYFAESP